MRADKHRLQQWYGGLITALVIAQLLLVMASWLLSAMMVGGVHSLLSSEGIRWFLGHFAQMLATPCLVWLLLIAMAGGCLWHSGALQEWQAPCDKTAKHAAIVVTALYSVVVVALVAAPHALLLSATGSLYQSPFSRAIIPILAFGVMLSSTVYGYASNRFTSLAELLSSLSSGIGCAAPAFVLYVLVVQFLASVAFVLGHNNLL